MPGSEAIISGWEQVSFPICLRARYARCSTDIACGGTRRGGVRLCCLLPALGRSLWSSLKRVSDRSAREGRGTRCRLKPRLENCKDKSKRFVHTRNVERGLASHRRRRSRAPARAMQPERMRFRMFERGLGHSNLRTSQSQTREDSGVARGKGSHALEMQFRFEVMMKHHCTAALSQYKSSARHRAGLPCSEFDRSQNHCSLLDVAD